jgi:preprotein translocase subunit SecF
LLDKELMVDSFSLIGFLPDNMVIWIQFGTRYFIDYIYLIIGIPLLVDFLIVWSPKLGMRFGGSPESEKSQEVAESQGVNAVNLDDRFKFMYVFARNPNLFQSGDSIESLDAEIVNIKKSYGSSDAGIGSKDGNGTSVSIQKRNQQKVTYSLSDRLLKNGLTTLHLSFIAVVVIVNLIGYWHYSEIFEKYFSLGERGYVMNYAKFDVASSEEREEVLKMRIKVEQINEVKYPEKKSQ